jgi:hypothetical protein
MIPNEGLLEYFIVFPNVLDHTSGRDIRALAALLGVEPLRASYWRVAEVLRLVPGATTVVMFVADAWAAWAWKGVALVSLVFGFLVRLLDIELIVKRGRSSAVIAGICLGHFGVFIGMTTAFQTAVLSGGLVFVLPLVVLARSNGVFLDPTVLGIKSFYHKVRHGKSTM